MFKNIEYFYLTFRVFISTIFETITCRTKPEYQFCNYEEEKSVCFKPLN